MVEYGLIVTSRERRSGSPGKPVVTREGDRFWVTEDRDGWVPATSISVIDESNPPIDLKTWETMEEAKKFGKGWKGHPWWCSPVGFEVVELRRRYRVEEVFEGWEVVR